MEVGNNFLVEREIFHTVLEKSLKQCGVLLQTANVHLVHDQPVKSLNSIFRIHLSLFSCINHISIMFHVPIKFSSYYLSQIFKLMFVQFVCMLCRLAFFIQ